MEGQIRLSGALKATIEFKITLEKRFGSLESETLRTGLDLLAQKPEDCETFFTVLVTTMNHENEELALMELIWLFMFMINLQIHVLDMRFNVHCIMVTC